MIKTALTGDRPTGPLHIGHYVGSLLNRVKLQHIYKQYIMIADIQALTDNFANSDKICDNVYEIALDYLAVGIDPNKTTIFIQSEIQELMELTIYFLNLVNIGRLKRNPTVKSEIYQKGYGDEIPVGFLCYPISQAADILAVKADIVPVGDDQIPMIEQTNEIVRKFNRVYNSTYLKEVTPYLSTTPRLPGIDGKAKMSKSLKNAIYLSDSTEAIKQKIFSMFTDPQHIKISDPGKIDGNMVFTYLDAFHENKEEVEELKISYQKGGLGDTKIKEILNDTLQNIISPIREQRNKIKISDIKDILYHGTQTTKIFVKETVSNVKDAMSIKYLN